MQGKTMFIRWRQWDDDGASMRPPRNAGENATHPAWPCPTSCFNEAPAKCRGKPRDVTIQWAGGGCFNEAPAKCRGKRPRLHQRRRLHDASMRPPRNAGENRQSVCNSGFRVAGFNEAPAKCRGKREDRQRELEDEAASMRPPRNAGENIPKRGEPLREESRFNEAPAKCRGKR